jgi:hypothetical protein
MCPGTAAAANPAILAAAAFAMQFAEIAQSFEMCGVPPDGIEGFFRDVTAIEVEKSAWLHDTSMGDKTKACSTQAATGDGIQAVGLESDLLAVLSGALPQNPIIMRRTGGLKLQGGLASLIVEPVEGLLIFPGVDLLIHDVLSSTGGHQQKDMVGDGRILGIWSRLALVMVVLI